MSASSNVTSGFIDLATFDEIEKYMYGGPDATAYFVRETRKSTWFTQVPVVLTKASGSAGFGTDWSVSISRAGDYLLQTWLRLTTPVVALSSAASRTSDPDVHKTIRWTRNLMHNIIKECNITFNDLVAARFDNYHLDFWAAFTVPASKRNGYDNMIGNVSDLTDPHGAMVPIPSYTLNLPLPFFYGRDSGVALPTAALPYNEMRINFSFRDFNELLIISYDDETTNSIPAAVTDLDGGAVPVLTAGVWANYAIVSNDERKRMACAPRDILIEQVQTAPRSNYDPLRPSSVDIRFSHAIRVLFFAVRNTTCKSEWSNYATSSPTVALSGGSPVISFYPSASADPIVQTSLIYENTNRLSQMGSDYFSLVNPYYHAPTVPDFIGYHSYSYSLDFMSLDPMGSTNYGKLTNVSIVPEASSSAVTAAVGVGVEDGTGTGVAYPQTFEFVITCINNNIIRVSGGKAPSVPQTVGCYKRCDISFMEKQCNISPFQSTMIECM
jgi:hypothetical protein